jgi:hypothetical protein
MLLSPDDFPRVYHLRQEFDRPRVADVRKEVQSQLARLALDSRIAKGQTVAVTAGSRGIAGIVEILAAAVAYLRGLGAQPFIVPAMGSHGGATDQGQVEVLARYGITEATCGCPIRSSMQTDVVFETPLGFPVHADRNARAADHVLIVGRVKPHTMYTGPVESGLCKMLLIGLGKQAGARVYHAIAHTTSFQTVVEAAVPRLIEELGVCGGLAIIENAYEETAHIEAVPPQAFLTREPELLMRAKGWMPRLPFDDVDVLILDEIGKNISGSGMDTTVVGRKHDDNKASPGETPRVRRIVIRDLSESTHGNAAGVGIGDFITRRLFDKIDFEATRINCMTAGHLGGAKVPPVFETDAETIAAALVTIGLTPPRDARLLWIKNTLELTEMWASEACRDVPPMTRCSMDGERRPLLDVLREMGRD